MSLLSHKSLHDRPRREPRRPKSSRRSYPALCPSTLSSLQLGGDRWGGQRCQRYDDNNDNDDNDDNDDNNDNDDNEDHNYNDDNEDNDDNETTITQMTTMTMRTTMTTMTMRTTMTTINWQKLHLLISSLERSAVGAPTSSLGNASFDPHSELSMIQKYKYKYDKYKYKKTKNTNTWKMPRLTRTPSCRWWRSPSPSRRYLSRRNHRYFPPCGGRRTYC